MFSSTDYVLRFAQTLVQILVLLVIVTVIGRYPDLVNSLTGIGVKVDIERQYPIGNGNKASSPTGSKKVDISPPECR